PVFDQYLRHAQPPLLELVFDDAKQSVSYRWKTDVPGFDMPIRVGERAAWQQISPTTEWQTLSTELGQERFEVATDLYYVKVTKRRRESD
ncbi:MAG: M1 family peptidase, partial [Planctomycetota bacterium]|nr:M1 family peptidase [Planctomycetota bacterium]